MESPLIAIGREAVMTALVASAPPLLAALAAGLLTGFLQALTQIQEPTLGVAPRIAAVLAALALAGPWIGEQLLRFAASALAMGFGVAR